MHWLVVCRLTDPPAPTPPEDLGAQQHSPATSPFFLLLLLFLHHRLCYYGIPFAQVDLGGLHSQVRRNQANFNKYEVVPVEIQKPITQSAPHRSRIVEKKI